MWAQFVRENNFRDIAEVGVWKGEFAKHLLLECPQIRSYLMVDSWRHLEGWNKPFNLSDARFEEVYHHALLSTAFAKEKVRVLRGTTLEVRQKIADESLDFIYIDGDHSLRGIVIDALSMWPKLRAGGVLAGDDFTETVWQHSRECEPSLVNPFMRYFADAVGERLHVLPHSQCYIQKSRSSGIGQAPAASAQHGLLPLLKLVGGQSPAVAPQMDARALVTHSKAAAKVVVRKLSSRYREYEAVGRHGERFPDCFTKTGILFVHVPKAAGTSISMTLYGRSIGHRRLSEWQTMFPHSVQKVKTFAVVRDPIARFVSAFQFLKAGGMNHVDHTFALENLSNYDSAEDLAEALVDPSLQGRLLGYPHFAKQHDFVKSDAGDIDIDCLVTVEQLGAAEKWVTKQLGRPTLFQAMNVGPKAGSKSLASPSGLAVLQSIYGEDLTLFNRLSTAARGVF
jgi:hypothetical protein